MTNVRNIIRELELKSKQEINDVNNNKRSMIHHGVVRMYNPEDGFGFIKLDDGKHVHFNKKTARRSGLNEVDIKIGMKVSVIVWQIRHEGPEVRTFVLPPKSQEPRVLESLLSAAAAEPPPKPVSKAKEAINSLATFKPAPATPPPPPKPRPESVVIPKIDPPLELVDEYGMRNSTRQRYPGGVHQLMIDQLKAKKIMTRDEISLMLVQHGYSGKSISSALSKLHEFGWFILNSGNFYYRTGRPIKK